MVPGKDKMDCRGPAAFQLSLGNQRFGMREVRGQGFGYLDDCLFLAMDTCDVEYICLYIDLHYQNEVDLR